MDRAGIETMLMNYYRHIDRNEVQFDFLCNKTKPGDYDSEILSMGGRILHTPGLNPFKFGRYLKYMKQLFKEHPEYKILHAHNDAFVWYSLYASKKNDIPTRISHVHSAAFSIDYKWPLKVICRLLIPSACTHMWACSKKAGRFYYGDKAAFHIHSNAIEISKYLFDANLRSQIRLKYGLEDNLVIGHVGRFVWQKNHTFLIDIFAEIYRRTPKARLVLLGEGSKMDTIKAKVESQGLSDAVLFMGSVSNVREWYQAFDMFILPSHWEGLPVVGVEAQAADLPTLFSDDITEEVKILPSTAFMSRKLPASAWAEKCMQMMHDHKTRKDCSKYVREAGYDIEIEAQKLVDTYKRLLAESESHSPEDEGVTTDEEE